MSNFFSKFFMVLVAVPLMAYNIFVAPFRCKGEKKKIVPLT
jgi:hypothetical protein